MYSFRPTYRIARALLLFALLAGLSAGAAAAQEVDTAAAKRNPYGTGAGLQILLTNNGFGLGAYYKHTLSRSTSFLVEANLGAGKDEREVKFFGSRGTSSIPYKANYLLMLPVQMGVQQRLFQEVVEENFRPYLQMTAGPTLGWEYPYFKDCDGDAKYDRTTLCDGGGFESPYDPLGSLPRGDLRFGLGGTIALGAHFGISKKMTQGVRIGYIFNYFFEDIELLEPDIPGAAQQFFGTPSISLTFGRLF